MEVWKMIFLFNWVIVRFHVIFQGCSHGTSNPDISTNIAVLLFFSWWAGHSIGHLCLICQDLCLEELAWKLIRFGDIHGNPYLGRFKVKMLVFVLNVPHAYQVHNTTNLGYSSKCTHMFHKTVPICTYSAFEHIRVKMGTRISFSGHDESAILIRKADH